MSPKSWLFKNPFSLSFRFVPFVFRFFVKIANFNWAGQSWENRGKTYEKRVNAVGKRSETLENGPTTVRNRAKTVGNRAKRCVKDAKPCDTVRSRVCVFLCVSPAMHISFSRTGSHQDSSRTFNDVSEMLAIQKSVFVIVPFFSVCFSIFC